ncbi:ABC transporter substrate-binding protein [Candidatus Clostridium stratigraminis]|uniref:ABC transporter substrate-binding protein n=1 Tax=Candidatus Clostridium stratigraminis TaxID=3381661 RepID=A0ABW8T4A6_9CLOT
MVGKKIQALLMVLLTASFLGACSSSQAASSNSNTKVIKIGITQIAEHPALDSARKGFLEALKSKGYEEGKNLKVDYENAQGDMATTQTIAQNFVSNKENLILAIATPSAQAAFNATKDIPIVITAVTDPVKAGLAKSLEKSDTNVTGTSDNVPIEKQLELLKKLIPKSKRVGVIYNTSESNSEVQLEGLKKAAPNFDLQVVTAGVTNVNEIPQALSSILMNIDVLYIPTDNMVASSLPLITNQCYSKKIPIIGAEKGHVTNGALATTGIDYNKLGFQTGLLAVDIINGKSPKDLPIVTSSEMQTVINTDAAKKLNITIPEDINSKAEKITGGVK